MAAREPGDPERNLKQLTPIHAAAGYLNQPVETVLLTPKTKRLTAPALKAWVVLLKFAHEQWKKDPDAVWLQVPMIRFLKETGLEKAHDYQGVRTRLMEMMAITVDWGPSPAKGAKPTAAQPAASPSDSAPRPTPGPTDNWRTVWQAAQLLGPVRFRQEAEFGAVYIEWTYPENLRGQLKEFSAWSQLHLNTYLSLERYAAGALYRLGSRYLTSAPHYLSLRIPIAKAVPFLTGKPLEIDSRTRQPKKLPEYRYFKRDTIGRGLQELHEKQDHFRLELIEHHGADGRTVTEIQFRVVPLAASRRPGEDAAVKRDSGLIDQAVELGLKREDAERYYKTYGAEQLLAAVNTTTERLAAHDVAPLGNPAGFLVAELKSGRAKQSIAPPAKQKELSLEDHKRETRQAYLDALPAAAAAFFAESTAELKTEMRAQYEAEVLPKLPERIQIAYKKGGLDRANSRKSMMDWVVKTYFRAEPNDEDLYIFAVSRQVRPVSAARPGEGGATPPSSAD